MLSVNFADPILPDMTSAREATETHVQTQSAQAYSSRVAVQLHDEARLSRR